MKEQNEENDQYIWRNSVVDTLDSFTTSAYCFIILEEIGQKEHFPISEKKMIL